MVLLLFILHLTWLGEWASKSNRVEHLVVVVYHFCEGGRTDLGKLVLLISLLLDLLHQKSICSSRINHFRLCTFHHLGLHEYLSWCWLLNLLEELLLHLLLE